MALAILMLIIVIAIPLSLVYILWMNYVMCREAKEREANRQRRANNMTRAKDDYVSNYTGDQDG